MFKPVSSRVSFPELDANVLQQWKEKDVFRRTESERQDAPLFMMYEGPPTANGSPGIHHVLARVFKDVTGRDRALPGHPIGGRPLVIGKQLAGAFGHVRGRLFRLRTCLRSWPPERRAPECSARIFSTMPS